MRFLKVDRLLCVVVLVVLMASSSRQSFATIGFNSNCTSHFTTITNLSTITDFFPTTTSTTASIPPGLASDLTYVIGRLLSQRPSQLPGKVELCKGGTYAISYEPSKLNPHFSTWKITTEQARSYITGRDSFIQDKDLRGIGVPQANASSTVWSTEWNRGHLAPSRMMSYSLWSKSETYYYSNVAPQWWYFNQQPWETLEQNLFEWVRDRNDTVLYITTGVEYFPWRRITNSFTRIDSVAMPDYYFTAVCDVASGESVAFIGANLQDDGGMLPRYRTVRELELEFYGTGGTLFDRQLCRTTSPVNTTHWGFTNYVTNGDVYGATPGIEDAINLTLWFPGSGWGNWVPSTITVSSSSPFQQQQQQHGLCGTVASPCLGETNCILPTTADGTNTDAPNSTRLVELYTSNITSIQDIVTTSLRSILITSLSRGNHFGFMIEVPYLVANTTAPTSSSSSSSKSSSSEVGMAVRISINFNRTLLSQLVSRSVDDTERGMPSSSSLLSLSSPSSSPTNYIAALINGSRFQALEAWYKQQLGGAATTTATSPLEASVYTPSDCRSTTSTTTAMSTTTNTTSATTVAATTTTKTPATTIPSAISGASAPQSILLATLCISLILFI